MTEKELKKEMQKDLGLEDLYDGTPIWIDELIDKLIDNGWKK